MAEKERVQVESREAWREWLEKNYNREKGVWLVTFKKHTGDKYVSYEETVEEAVCFGWIDSTARRVDEDRTMMWMSPRKAGSGWSRSNKERVERLTAADLMMPPGLEKIEAAKADGSWNALDAIENLEVPPDLAEAFGKYESAEQNFEAFTRSAKRAILVWIANAKRPKTRAKRVAETARLAEENIPAK
ncbi:MAG: YdeI/OmpD-associated family protein [Candidatus Promineifilaceae bacterium]